MGLETQQIDRGGAVIAQRDVEAITELLKSIRDLLSADALAPTVRAAVHEALERRADDGGRPVLPEPAVEPEAASVPAANDDPLRWPAVVQLLDAVGLQDEGRRALAAMLSQRLASDFLAREAEQVRATGALFKAFPKLPLDIRVDADTLRAMFAGVTDALPAQAALIWAEPGDPATGSRFTFVEEGDRLSGGGKRVRGLIHPGIELDGRVVLPAFVKIDP